MEITTYGNYQNGTYWYFITSYSIIIFLNILSILYYIFNTYVCIKVKDFKRNVHRVNQAVYVTCPIGSAFLITEKILDILGKREEFESNNEIYINLQYLRIAILAPPFSSLIFTMLERLCATYYIKDYEKKPRPFIGYSLIFLLYASSIFISYIINFTKYFLTFSVVHLILNLISYAILLWTYRLNRNYYFKNRVMKNEYSLGERYQISENIRVYKYFTRYLFVIVFFNSVSGVILISSFFSSPNVRRVLSFFFDLSYTLLTIFGPYFSLQMSESWQNEFDMILVKMKIRRPTKVDDINERSKKLRNTFGEKMVFERIKHSDVYFEQLKDAWNRETIKVTKT